MVTQGRVQELLHYNPDTGILTRKVRTAQRNQVGSVAGQESHGYLKIMLDGKWYACHRIVWLYVHGKWPDYDVDHIDRDKKNNRLTNLRDVDRTTNLQNQVSARTDSSTGLRGVSPHQGKYRAIINAKGKRICLGSGYCTPEEAHAAYLTAKKIYHPECNY